MTRNPILDGQYPDSRAKMSAKILDVAFLTKANPEKIATEFYLKFRSINYVLQTLFGACMKVKNPSKQLAPRFWLLAYLTHSPLLTQHPSYTSLKKHH
jgi:hypothetical protein